MNTLKVFISGLVIMLCSLFLAGTSHSDPLELAIDDTGAGLSIASTGVGLENLGSGTETITIDIGGPVISAYLYWAGRERNDISKSPEPADQELLFAGESISGVVIGTEASRGSYNIGYRADVTDTLTDRYTGPGTYSFDVQDNDLSENLQYLNGASLLVVYTDESDAAAYRLIVFDGLDFTYYDTTPYAATITDPVTFNYESTDAYRSAELLIVAGDLEAEREDRIDISDNVSIENELNGSSGENWDNDLFTVDIPSDKDSTTVEVISPADPGTNPDSLLWVLTALRLPITSNGGGEGCTPDYWQTHTDNWPVPYSPGDSFFSIFGRTIETAPVEYGIFKNSRGVKKAASNAPAGITLLDALQANGECTIALATQAVAALLNAASDINYHYSVSEIILMVHSAIPEGEPFDCETVEETRDTLISQNELWCPLDTPPIPPPPPVVFEVILSPATATVKPGETIDYTAFTTRNGVEVRSAFNWEIIPDTTIGSSIDEDTQVYTAGDTCSETTETIQITDIRHFNLTATAAITVAPPLCEVEISPLSSTVKSGETVEFTAVTTCDGNEVENSSYQWDIASTIGSTLNGAEYTSGENNTDGDTTDIITVTDTAYCNATGAANVTVTPKEPTLPDEEFLITISPDKKIMASGGELTFTAVTVNSTTSSVSLTQPSSPNYAWSVESVIGSHIDAVTGIYTSGENTVGHQAMDTISVIDHANNNSTESIEIMVTYGKITAIADFKYWPIPFNTPPTILVSRWFPGYFIGVLAGENLNTTPSTVLRFEPDDDILLDGSWQMVFGDIIVFGIPISPNPAADEITIIVDSDGELAVSNDLRLTIGLLPWDLDVPR